MSEEKNSYTAEQKAELSKVGKLPKGEKRTEALKLLSEKWRIEKRLLEKTMHNLRRKTVKKKKERKHPKVEEKTVGQKSYETRMRNKELGITPKRYKKRKYHNSPVQEKKLGVTRNELRFPYKKISIEGGEVVVSF